MKTLKLINRCLTLPFFLLALLAGQAMAQDFSDNAGFPMEEEEEDLGEFFDKVPVPEGMTKEEIKQTLALVLANREWTVTQKTDRRVVGYLKHRGNEATVTLLFGVEDVSIYCEGWAIDKRGERRKPEQPTGWLKFIRKDITKQFGIFSATR